MMGWGPWRGNCAGGAPSNSAHLRDSPEERGAANVAPTVPIDSRDVQVREVSSTSGADPKPQTETRAQTETLDADIHAAIAGGRRALAEMLAAELKARREERAGVVSLDAERARRERR